MQFDYQIYVDGSKLNESVGYGVVILRNGEFINEIYGTVPEDYVQGTNQIAGELFAVRKAIEWCWENSVKEVSIFYDCIGIKKWATGEWKTKHPQTQEYAEFVRSSLIKIDWHKVDSHTGDVWNERADKLAKSGSITTEDVQPPDLQNETQGFAKFLESNGYKAILKGIYNSNCAKIQVREGDNDFGYVNIYLTKKNELTPRYHELKDNSYEAILDSLWNDYRYGEKQLLLF
jgi:viroplasmin and RNaseH domain-containing protein